MICTKCQFENRQDATFCEECGGRLHYFCPACGTKISEEISFCIRCGQSLQAIPSSLLQEAELARGERHREHYVPRVRSARIASVLDNVLALKEESKVSDISRDHLEHSLTQAFEDPWLAMHDDSDVSGFVHDYWQAIKELWPKAFNDSNSYFLRDMLGFSILHRVFPDVIRHCRKAGDFSKDTMKQVLADTGIGSEFWHERNLIQEKDPELRIVVAVNHIKERFGSHRPGHSAHRS